MSTQVSKSRVPSRSERLLSLMTNMLIGLTLFFFVASLFQLGYLQYRAGSPPPALSGAANQETGFGLLTGQLAASFALEHYVVDRRYHQANTLLMSRMWMGYLGFVTGMILAMVGAAFVLGRLREPSTDLDAQAMPIRIGLKTSSPGLVLAVLGTLLMTTTLIAYHPIETTDGAVYFKQESVGLAAENPPWFDPPQLVDPDEKK